MNINITLDEKQAQTVRDMTLSRLDSLRGQMIRCTPEEQMALTESIAHYFSIIKALEIRE
jgi:DNA gyrase/topoisomerase IV subunit A